MSVTTVQATLGMIVRERRQSTPEGAFLDKKHNISPRAAVGHSTSCHSLALFALATSLSSGMAAHAAGGHHAVDDAVLLEPGRCQFETWWDHESGGARSLLHAGPSCRVGPVELGLNIERARLDGVGTSTVSGVQVKSAVKVHSAWSAGVVLGFAAQDRAPHYSGSSLVVPVTWQTTETLSTHFNVGRDFRHGQPDTPRGGVALEWAPLKAWTFVAERFREGGADFWRAGARWSVTPSMDLDLSHAGGLKGGAPAWWTLGLTWSFDR